MRTAHAHHSSNSKLRIPHPYDDSELKRKRPQYSTAVQIRLRDLPLLPNTYPFHPYMQSDLGTHTVPLEDLLTSLGLIRIYSPVSNVQIA